MNKLNAAEQLFSESGFAGASMLDPAEASGVSLAKLFPAQTPESFDDEYLGNATRPLFQRVSAGDAEA
ncbi:MAG: helix-turn-helix transcriptional regulator [bacterium]|nr:helix-turn-helix transcriptional regulator [bacterium]